MQSKTYSHKEGIRVLVVSAAVSIAVLAPILRGINERTLKEKESYNAKMEKTQTFSDLRKEGYIIIPKIFEMGNEDPEIIVANDMDKCFKERKSFKVQKFQFEGYEIFAEKCEESIAPK